MWLWRGAAEPEPEPAPAAAPAATTKPKLDWRQVASQASEKQAQDPAAAADVLRSVLQMQADAPEVRRELGKLRCALGFALGAAGEVSPAAAEFSAVLRLAEQGRQPGSVQPVSVADAVPHARYGLGMCELARDKASAAIAELQRCVEGGGGDAQALLALGLALLQAGRAGDAVARLEAAVKAERDWERAKEAVAVLAEAFRGAGRQAEAVSRYAHCVEMGGRPSRVAAGHRGLGLAALHSGEELAGAAEHFARSLDVLSTPSNGADSDGEAAAEDAQAVAVAQRCRGLVLRRQGAYADSVEAFRAIAGTEDAAAGLGLALSLWRGGDAEAAGEACERVAGSSDKGARARARGLQAALAAEAADGPRALELGMGALSDGASSGSDQSALHCLVAWAQRKCKSVADSVASYQAALSSLSRTAGTSKELAKALFGADPEAVLELLLGQAMLAAGRETQASEEEQEQACDHIERAVILIEGALEQGEDDERNPRRISLAVQCACELGLNAGFCGRYAEAAEHLQHAVELDETHAEAHAQLATALSYLDQADASEMHYEKATALRKDTPAAPPDESARLLGIELMQEAEEAAQYFAELSAHRRLALAQLPRLPGPLWTRADLWK